jgi:O-antigen ligase
MLNRLNSLFDEVYLYIILLILSFSTIQKLNVIHPILYISLLFGIILINKSSNFNHKSLFYIFVVFFSIIFNFDNLDLNIFFHFISYLFLIVIFGPILHSNNLFQFRYLFLKYSIFIFILISLLSFYFYLSGFTFFLYNRPPFNSFQGITTQPMLLAPITSIGLIYLFHEFKRSKYKLLIFILSIILIYVLLSTGSRSALFSFLVVNIFLLKKNYFFYITIFILIIYFFITYYSNIYTEMAIFKKINSINSANSRDYIWSVRFIEFKTSPIFGIGYSSDTISKKFHLSNIEPGSTWLYILSSTGLLGLVLFFNMLASIKIEKSIYNLPVSNFFLFFLIHGIFEGYITFAGSYMSFFFWTLLGLSYSNQFKKNNFLNEKDSICY